MKLIWKIIKNILVVAVVGCIVLLVIGYSYYRYAIEVKPVEITISRIMDDEEFVTLDQLDSDFINAVIAVEDNSFYQRNGLDFMSIIRAVMVNLLSGKIVMGGSTITQQLAKNIFFTQDQTFVRKFAEIFMIYDLESRYSKKEILAIYVNTNYYGDNYTGIKKAASGYFDCPPLDLTLAQASMLAGLPNAPSVYQLSSGFELAKLRQKTVLDYLVKFDYINQEQADSAYEEVLGYEN